ncbi:MAG: 4-hydroxybenzoate octaprenyltransferase [SAR86 cluster bacterium]|jgi:4-hydroxybenzoate polyprenyltransferase|nr:4-hydroxybenzoate octaprenyltransferase [SAR86 cluster bacterium]
MKTKIISYIRLARLDKPIGIYLLLWPALLGLLLGTIAEGYIDFENILIVVIGSVLVRSCGCVINDISDHDFDRLVERTKNRPLASREISVKGAWIFFSFLSLASLSLLLITPPLTIKLALFFSLLILFYPLAKRFLKAPQLILGITFGSSSLISYSLQSASYTPSIIVLYFGLIAWIVSFDTFYALEDIDDDRKIGINSTPLLWGEKATTIANFLHIIFLFTLSLIAYINSFSIFFLFTMFCLIALFYFQNQLVKEKRFLEAFKLNNYVGMVAVFGFTLEIFFL